MAGRATGDLEGVGVWRLFEEGGVTAVIYEWEVEGTRAWMNALGPLPRPIFRWSHDRVMAAVASEGLVAHSRRRSPAARTSRLDAPPGS